MARVTWKMAVLIAVLAIFAILEFQTAEAQTTACSQCANHANCYYSSYYGYYCRCRRGYRGDGISGVGYSGCRKRHLSVWRIILAIVFSVIGALLLLCLCLALLFRALAARRRNRPPIVQQGDPVYHPQQASYPQQGVPMATYETQKVPGPTGVV